MTKIYVDLDGVCANFDKAIVKHCQIHYWDRATPAEWTIMEQVPRLFYSLEVMPHAKECVEKLISKHGTDIVEVLTALPNPTDHLVTSDHDKREWVRDFIHPDIKVNTVVGGKNKYKWLGENPKSVLIDDYHRNISLWIQHGGVGILHTDWDSTMEKLKVLKLI